jgi:bisphosphoglycerate-independent phosphoglycerate mutase (AlkP superfamily)
MATPVKKKTCLIVIDGWGIGESKEGVSYAAGVPASLAHAV